MRLGAKVGARYRLTEGPLGGGSGEVWLARDEDLDRDVVLKRVLAAEQGPGGAEFDRLRAESRVLARFSHPHVVTLYDAVRTGTQGRATSWLVMEYAAGGSLEGRAPLDPRLAAHLGAQIADALVAVHAQGIVHGDVAPGNVVVTRDGTAKLAGFGTAYRVGGDETVTPGGAVGCTPEYAAPEVVQGRPEPASDVFSLGATLYALVAGRPPRSGEGSADDETGAFVARPSEAGGDVELNWDVGPLRELLTTMLARAAEARPDPVRVRALLRDVAGPPDALPPLPPRQVLDRDADGDPDVADLPWPEGDVQDTLPRPAPGPLRRHPGRVAAAATALVVLAVGGGLWAAHGSGSGSGDDRPKADPTSGSRTPPSPTPGSLLGDHRTADPCALLDPSAVREYGTAKVDPAYGGFERCDVIVHRSSGDDIDVETELVQGPLPDGLPSPTRENGRVALVKAGPYEGECENDLQLPGSDNAYVDIVAQPAGDGSPSPGVLCALADAVADHAYDVLSALPPGHHLARRSAPFAPASLAAVDACTLLTGHDLEIVPGVDADGPDAGFGDWACSWGSATSDHSVSLRYDRRQPPGATDGEVTRFGGVTAVVHPPDEEDPHTRHVTLVYRTFTGTDGARPAETVELVVAGDSLDDDPLRTMAAGLAADVARRLPAG